MISGTTAAGFEGVADAFRRNFDPTAQDPGDLGAGLSVFRDGELVVDLVGGHRDRARTSPWTRDTLVNIYSVGKPMAAVVALAAVERGRLDLDASLASVWTDLVGAPTTLRMILGHRAGRPSVRADLPEDAYRSWRGMTDALAASAPWWEPGTAHGYHVNTFGFLAGHPAVLALDAPFSVLFRSIVAEACGADLISGLGVADLARCAEIDAPIGDRPAGSDWPAGTEREDMIFRTYFNPPALSGIGVANTTAWRQAVVPSTNTHGTALGVARFYDALVRPAGLLASELATEATRIHSDETDLILGRHSRFGLGFQLDHPDRPIGLSAHSFGHFGYGGSLGFGDPVHGLAVGYVINRPGDRWQNPRVQRVRAALAEAVG